MGVYLPAARLPSTYQEVERIQSSGTQYLNTSKYVETGHKYVAKFQFKAANAWSTFGGHYGNSSSNRLFAGMAIVNGAVWGYGFGSSTAYTYGSAATDTDYEVETLLKSGSQYFKLNGNTLFTNTFTYSSSTSHNIKVFASAEPNNSAGIWTSTRMYYWKLYNTSDQLELDLVPCYRKSDSVIGMYDLVNNQFYTNSGSGTFTKGPDAYVNQLKSAFIGPAWSPSSNTIAYYPLTATTQLTDQSGNGRNLTNGGTGVFGTYGGVSCVNFPSRNKSLYNTSVSVGTIRTLAARCYITGTTNDNYGVVYTGNKSYASSGQLFGMSITHDSSGNHPGTANRKDGISPCSLNISGWTFIVCVGSGTNHTLYVNGQKISSNTYTSIASSSGIYIGGVSSGSDNPFQGYISNVIVESEEWTANDVLNYFNSTKATYGIS